MRGEGRKGEGKKGRRKKEGRRETEVWVMWRFVPLDSLPSKAASHGGRHERTFARRGRKEVSSHSTVSTQLFTMMSL